MRILVLNCGSSTLKYGVWEVDGETEEELAAGVVEGQAGTAAAGILGEWGGRVDAVGHRIVHGGTKFRDAVRVDEEVRKAIQEAGRWAPLHNAPGLAAVEEAVRLLGTQFPQVAVFDTAFHQTMPERAWRYALPREAAERWGLRRFGFHGISHQWAALRYAELSGRNLPEVRLVSLHLGNGCSACAIARGRSVDTSMGMTPLEGLVMGTRAGDADAGMLLWWMEQEGWTAAQMERVLVRESGLKGLTGGVSDMREVAGMAGRGLAEAEVALEVFCYRICKYVGAYAAAMGGLDAVIFTGGIGENQPRVREMAGEGLEFLGWRLDSRRNGGVKEGPVHAEGAGLEVWVIPAQEERLIAREVWRLVGR
jgi:acetate kinase